MKRNGETVRKKALMLSSVASMIDQFNMPNIRLLLELGYDVDVACNFEKGNTCDRRQIDRMQRTLRELGVAGHQWDCPRNIRAVRACCIAYGQLVRLLRSQRYDLIHCHSPIGAALARLAAHRERIPVIYTAHGFHFYRGAPLKNWLLYYPVEAALAHWTEVLITVNQEDYRFAKRYLKAKKVCRIPGVGIDIKQLQTPPKRDVRHKYHIPEDARILLSVGELSRRKNHRMVLSALAKLRKENVYYMICGQGALKKELLRQAVQLGVAKRVRVVGFQRDVSALYWNADIFVFPSVQEGMPAALMEAMAVGLPCVVSDIRGNRELIDAQGGVRFSVRKKGQLPEALTKLLENETLRQSCGSYNRRKIRAYDTQVVQAQMRKIYGQMKHKQKNTKQVKVLHILKSGHFAGAEHIALTICKNCREPYQAAYASEKGEIQERLQKDGIAYFPMKKLNLKELNRVIRAYQPDIVHAHDFTASVLCALVKRRYLLISHLHNNPLWIRRWNIRSVCYRAMRHRMDAVLLVSKAIREEAVFLKDRKSRAIVVGNPVNVRYVRQLAQEAVADAPDLLFVGRLTRQKAPEQFIRIVYGLCKKGIPVRALMLGEGELLAPCRALIRKLGLTEIVCMKGFVSNPYPYMRQARLLLMPSAWEGYGLAAAEALAVGTPVLVSPVGGLKEQLLDIPYAWCSSENAFVKKAAKLLTDQKLYEAYRKKILRRACIGDLDTYMQKLQYIYEGCKP